MQAAEQAKGLQRAVNQLDDQRRAQANQQIWDQAAQNLGYQWQPNTGGLFTTTNALPGSQTYNVNQLLTSIGQ